MTKILPNFQVMNISGVVCLKIVVSLGNALDLFRKLFGAAHAILGLWGFSLPLENSPCVVTLLAHSDLPSRPPYIEIFLLGFTGVSPLD